MYTFTGYEIYDTARNKGFKAKAFDTLQKSILELVSSACMKTTYISLLHFINTFDGITGILVSANYF